MACPHAFDRSDSAHRASCPACVELDRLVARHERAFAAVPTPAAPAELRDRSFLDRIYERAARDLAAELPDAVGAELTRTHRPPEDLDDLLLESPALRSLGPTRAPGLLGPRLAAEIRSVGGELRRARRRARLVRGLAAAAVVTLAVWIARSQPEQTPLESNELAIVHLRADAPFAPGFSTSEIVRSIAGGGHRGR